MKSIAIEPITKIDTKVQIPGSKSITNRALVIAALANGQSVLENVLFSEDTELMIAALQKVGIRIDQSGEQLTVYGSVQNLQPCSSPIFLGNSGTCMRFLTTMLILGKGKYELGGTERMHDRPIKDLVDALQGMGHNIKYKLKSGYPPLVIQADALKGGMVRLNANISSQYLTSLLLSCPYAQTATTIMLNGHLVSRPYIDMTLQMMDSFGVIVMSSPDSFNILPQEYQSQHYWIEPDASNASYFFAAAAITNGKVLVKNLHKDSLQGDIHFVDILEKMGCTVEDSSEGITVQGSGLLKGIEIDMEDMPDMVQTLACVAVFANAPTTITNVGNLVHKETDRLSAVATELSKLGVQVERLPDGLKIYPGIACGGQVSTYNDHRMAMSFSLLGLKQQGIEILDPQCVEKTFPKFFEVFLNLK